MLTHTTALLHPPQPHYERHSFPAPETLVGKSEWIDAQRSPPPLNIEVRVRWLDGCEGIAIRRAGLGYTLRDNTFTSCVVEWMPVENSSSGKAA